MFGTQRAFLHLFPEGCKLYHAGFPQGVPVVLQEKAEQRGDGDRCEAQGKIMGCHLAGYHIPFIVLESRHIRLLKQFPKALHHQDIKTILKQAEYHNNKRLFVLRKRGFRGAQTLFYECTDQALLNSLQVFKAQYATTVLKPKPLLVPGELFSKASYQGLLAAEFGGEDVGTFADERAGAFGGELGGEVRDEPALFDIECIEANWWRNTITDGHESLTRLLCLQGQTGAVEMERTQRLWSSKGHKSNAFLFRSSDPHKAQPQKSALQSQISHQDAQGEQKVDLSSSSLLDETGVAVAKEVRPIQALGYQDFERAFGVLRRFQRELNFSWATGGGENGEVVLDKFAAFDLGEVLKRKVPFVKKLLYGLSFAGVFVLGVEGWIYGKQRDAFLALDAGKKSLPQDLSTRPLAEVLFGLRQDPAVRFFLDLEKLQTRLGAQKLYALSWNRPGSWNKHGYFKIRLRSGGGDGSGQLATPLYMTNTEVKKQTGIKDSRNPSVTSAISVTSANNPHLTGREEALENFDASAYGGEVYEIRFLDTEDSLSPDRMGMIGEK